MLLLTLIVTATFAFFIYVIKVLSKNVNYWKKKGAKYVKPLPLFGNMLPRITQSMSMPELIESLYNTFPNERYVGMYQFITPVLLIRDPELIKTVTIKNFENFTDHTGFVSEEVDPLWGKNLFSTKGERWKDLRQTLSPAFTSSKMRAMFILMDECAKQLVNFFKENDKDVIEVELKDIFSRYTTDIIASTAFGIKCDSLKFRDNEFLAAGRELTNFTGINRFKFILYGSFPKLTKFFKVKLVNDRVGIFFRTIINETIHLRETKNIIRPDLIHLLMLARKGKLKYEDFLNLPEAGFAAVEETTMEKSDQTSPLTNEDITAQAIVFFLGGFDTSSTLMCFTGYELAVNPHIQKKLRNEIQTTSLKCNGKISYEILLSMKYLDMVVSETLRKWPQGIWLDRKCTKAFEIKPENEGESLLKINVGDVCWIPAYAIHRDPKYYPNPDVFDPERFNEENKNKIQTSTYLPFGIGPRNCIGSRFALLETKILLYYILAEYEFVPIHKTQIPLKIEKNSAVLEPENGFHIGLKRNKNVV